MEQVLLWIVILLIVVDIILYTNRWKGDTISNIIKDWINGKYFFLTFLWGALAGHFFLGIEQAIITKKIISLIIVLGIAAILFIAGFFFGKRMNRASQAILLISGILVGHFFWSVNYFPTL